MGSASLTRSSTGKVKPRRSGIVTRARWVPGGGLGSDDSIILDANRRSPAVEPTNARTSSRIGGSHGRPSQRNLTVRPDTLRARRRPAAKTTAGEPLGIARDAAERLVAHRQRQRGRAAAPGMERRVGEPAGVGVPASPRPLGLGCQKHHTAPAAGVRSVNLGDEPFRKLSGRTDARPRRRLGLTGAELSRHLRRELKNEPARRRFEDAQPGLDDGRHRAGKRQARGPVSGQAEQQREPREPVGEGAPVEAGGGGRRRGHAGSLGPLAWGGD